MSDTPHDQAEIDGDLTRWRQAIDAATFEETFAALEGVVARLEQGGLRLGDSLVCYELGVRLAERCGHILDDAELRVSRLDETLTEAESWDDEEFSR